jgi:hypothetical protein
MSGEKIRVSGTALVFLIASMTLVSVNIVLGWIFLAVGVIWTAAAVREDTGWAAVSSVRRGLFVALNVITFLVCTITTGLQLAR